MQCVRLCKHATFNIYVMSVSFVHSLHSLHTLCVSLTIESLLYERTINVWIDEEGPLSSPDTRRRARCKKVAATAVAGLGLRSRIFSTNVSDFACSSPARKSTDWWSDPYQKTMNFEYHVRQTIVLRLSLEIFDFELYN